MTVASASSEVARLLASTRPLPTGDAALRAGLHARRLLFLKSLLVRLERLGGALGPAARRRFERDWALLESAERADPSAVRDVLDYPMTGAWLAEALAAPDGPALERHLAHLGGVALAAAIRAGCPVGGTRTLPTGVLALPGLGTLRRTTPEVRLTGRAGTVRMADPTGRQGPVLLRTATRPDDRTTRVLGGGPGWSALRTLPGSAIVLDDLDPYRVPPHGIGPGALPAAERPQSARRLWAQRWSEAHTLLSATDPGRAAEIGAVLRAVVPLAPERRAGGAPRSATARAAPGAVLAQLPGDGGELAESLVHETQHTKLAALHDLSPLCVPGAGTLHRVGWRPDPRPVMGVLQGVYAHLALVDLWWRARRTPSVPSGWRRRAGLRLEIYREHVGEALSALGESDELTLVGREFVRGMGRHHAGLGRAARSLR
ncbi:HEXXH motif domain-containing protein [Streptomyces sp. NPDC001508]|uniref:HEXXH motif domain-containing protein n=1 Tax=Streptomyces sp. NPDC001508 TaxID=3154656 RepID=UPI00332B77C8